MSNIKKHYIKDLVYGVGVVVIFFILGILFWEEIVHVITKVPFIDHLYNLGLKEIEQRSIMGLSLVTLTGSLFFIGYPAELLYFIYVSSGYNSLYISLVMLFYMMLGQMLNYGIGYFINEKFVHRFVKHREEDYIESVAEHDKLFIIVINILPVPSDVLSVVLGIIKYDPKKAFFYTLIGRILKIFFLVVLVLMIQGFY